MESTIKLVQDKLISKNDFPVFSSGDTITVYYEIREGEKVRTQSFKGVVVQVNLKLSQLEKYPGPLELRESSH